MKKILVVLVVLCATFTTVNAGSLKFGVRAGVNILNMSTDFGQTLSASNRAGFYVGPTIKFSIIGGLGVDASAEYDQRTSEISSGTVSSSITSRQIAIPVNLRYDIGLGSKINVFPFTGPQFGFNLSGDEKLFGTTDWSWKTSNFSWNVGVGFTLLNHLELRGSYNIACGTTGEATVWNTATSVTEGTFKSKYNSWQIGLCWYF